MKVGDLVILADRRTVGLITQIKDRRVYRVLWGSSPKWLIRSQIWKVINENR